MKIITSDEFDFYWKSINKKDENLQTEATVKEIIAAVRKDGDAAVRHYASCFDKSSPQQLELPLSMVHDAAKKLRADNPELVSAIELAADHIQRFALKQKAQFYDFEYEMEPGLITGQRVIPVDRAAVYVPAGRFPLFSTVLMTLIPAICSGVQEVILASPPLEDGFPDRTILAAAGIASGIAAASSENTRLKVFTIGGAQAIAALALGTETVPRADLIAGPGNRYVAAAKRLLFGEAGIDFIAGPSDTLIISDGSDPRASEFAAADMIAQAEHDPDACARALVCNRELAQQIITAIKHQVTALHNAGIASASLESNGLIVVYNNKEEAIRIANTIAPEHLELHVAGADNWIPRLKNYGSLFSGTLSAEVLGDYSAGINHTLPTSGSARFSGGLSVRHFLKTVTTLRCIPSTAYSQALHTAEILARAEGLEAHALSALIRK